MNQRERDERIDEAVEQLLEKGVFDTSDAELEELMKVAARLRELPDPEYKGRLRSALFFEKEKKPGLLRRILGAPAQRALIALTAVVVLGVVLIASSSGAVQDSVASAFGGDGDGCMAGNEDCVGQEEAAAEFDWDTLRSRALDLPAIAPGADCPLSEPAAEWPAFKAAGLGQGPAYPVMANIVSPTSAEGSKTLWVSDSTYNGPLLVRGGQIDGANPIYFVYGGDSGLTELTLPEESNVTAPGAPAGWRQWPAGLYVQQPGCYALQIDGADFTTYVVFQATGCGLKLCILETTKTTADQEASEPAFHGVLGGFEVVGFDDWADNDCQFGVEAPTTQQLTSSELYFTTEMGTEGERCEGQSRVFRVSGELAVTGEPPVTARLTRFYYEGDLLRWPLEVTADRLVLRQIAGREALVVLRNQDVVPECQVLVRERAPAAGVPGIALHVSGALTCTAAKALAEEFLLSLES